MIYNFCDKHIKRSEFKRFYFGHSVPEQETAP